MNSEHARWMLDSASQRRRYNEEYQHLKAEGSPGQRQFDEASKPSLLSHATAVVVDVRLGLMRWKPYHKTVAISVCGILGKVRSP